MMTSSKGRMMAGMVESISGTAEAGSLNGLAHEQAAGDAGAAAEGVATTKAAASTVCGHLGRNPARRLGGQKRSNEGPCRPALQRAQALVAGSVVPRLGTLACLLAVLLLSGCGQFFAKTTTTTTPTTNTGDYLYVANYNTSLDTVAGFSVATTGALTATTSSPYTAVVVPTTVAVTPANTFLYVGSSLGAIYVYSISSTGQLTIADGGVSVATAAPTSMAVDSTGNWLLVEQPSDSGGPVIYVYSIDQTTGALTAGTATPYVALDAGTTSAASSSGNLLLVPNSTLVYASLGLGGVDALTFDSSTGTLTKLSILLSPRGSGYSDQRLATNSTGTYLFVTETGGNTVRTLTINADGNLSELSTSPTAAGHGVGAVVVDSTDTYLYVANSTDNTISAFTISSTGALTAITGSPFATGSTPTDMVEDNTHAYLAVACFGGTHDLQIFNISTTTAGALVSTATASTATVSPAGAYAIAATH